MNWPQGLNILRCLLHTNGTKTADFHEGAPPSFTTYRYFQGMRTRDKNVLSFSCVLHNSLHFSELSVSQNCWKISHNEKMKTVSYKIEIKNTKIGCWLHFESFNCCLELWKSKELQRVLMIYFCISILKKLFKNLEFAKHALMSNLKKAVTLLYLFVKKVMRLFCFRTFRDHWMNLVKVSLKLNWL